VPTIDAHATRRVGEIDGDRAGDAAVTVIDLGTSPTTRAPDSAFPATEGFTGRAVALPDRVESTDSIDPAITGELSEERGLDPH